MNARIEWTDDSRTILQQIFTGKWTWDEFYEIAQEAKKMMVTVDHTVHLVSDL